MSIEMNPVSQTAQVQMPMQSVYINSFRAGCSASDVFIILQLNGIDFAALNMSYTLAKTLGEALKTIIDRLETGSGQKIMTVDTIAKAIRPNPPSESPSK